MKGGISKPISLYSINNNLYIKRVTQSNGKDLPWVSLACIQVARVPQIFFLVFIFYLKKKSSNFFLQKKCKIVANIVLCVEAV